MAQLEELLEKKPDAVSEDMGYSTPSDAYPEDEWEKQKLKGWPRQIHVFGMRQNQINRLRLSTQLNSNALDRILRQPEPESAEKENDSQES